MGYKIFFATSFLYLSLILINPSNKIIVIFFFLYMIGLWLTISDFKLAALLTYLASLPINVGKTYLLNLIPSWMLNIQQMNQGIATSVIIAPRDVLIVFLLAIIAREIVLGNKRLLRIDKVSLVLICYLAVNVISAHFGSLIPGLSVLNSIFEIHSIVLYLYGRMLIFKRDQLFIPTISTFAASANFESLVAFFQLIKKSPIGLSIEASQDFIRIDKSLEAIDAFRPVGTFSHANVLANYLIPLIFIFISYHIKILLREVFINNVEVITNNILMLLVTI